MTQINDDNYYLECQYKPKQIWLIKQAGMNGHINLGNVYFPIELIGKKIRIKIEFIKIKKIKRS